MAPRKPKKPEVDEAQELYVRWARAWIITRDDVSAAIAVGVPAKDVEQFLKMAEYSEEAQRIKNEELIFTPDFKSPEKLREAVLSQLWREARNSSSASGAAARVAALRAIADIGGIEDPEAAKGMSNNGGMLFVPVMKMDDWEKACTKAQALLKADINE